VGVGTIENVVLPEDVIIDQHNSEEPPSKARQFQVEVGVLETA
jgi:hypothetical protein